MGLRYAQVDLDLFREPKVRRLFRRQSQLVAYGAMGLWVDILVASWSEEDRVAASEVCDDDDEDVGKLVAALRDVRLLDDDGRIPERAWSKWWGPILDGREAARLRKERQRSRSVQRDKPGQDVTTEDDAGRRGTFTSLPFSSLPSPGGDSLSSSREGLDVTHYDLTGRVLRGRGQRWATDLEKEYGVETACRVMAETMRTTMDADNLLRNTADALALASNAAARREEEERADRIEQARSDRAKRQLDELRKLQNGAAEPRPLADLMPEVAKSLGRKK